MSVLDNVVGLVAPIVCVSCGVEGTALCENCSRTKITPYGSRCFDCGAVSGLSRTCVRCSPSAPKYVWVTTNYENAAQDLIKTYKFGHQRAAALPIAQLMSQTISSIGIEPILRQYSYLIISVPTATSRVRQRGFDHSGLLASKIARQIKLAHLNALLRLGQSRQVGAIRSLRVKQLENKFRVRYKYKIAGRNILLIDDVVTTGATLRAATKVLREAGATRIDALAFAKRL